MRARRVSVLALLLFALSGCIRTDGTGRREVRVTLTEFAVHASTRTFTAGVPYRLFVTNRGQVNHELQIGTAGVHGGPGEVARVDEMILQPGAAHVVDVTFPESVRNTDLEFACHLPAHYEFGMRLSMTVR